MSVNNFDMDRILSELDAELINARDEIASEVRLDNEEEIRDCIQYSQRESTWVERLHAGLLIHIAVTNNRIKGTIQHACKESIVIVSDDSIYVVPTGAVTFIYAAPLKISPRVHADHRCWRSILHQVHDIKVFIGNDFYTGTVAVINRDAFDFVGSSSRMTIPWTQISFVEIAL